LSALSKNAAITQQQQKILSSTAGNKADALDSPRRLPTLVPVPYRNSKLTHLLKDSLGDLHLLLMQLAVCFFSLLDSSRRRKLKDDHDNQYPHWQGLLPADRHLSDVCVTSEESEEQVFGQPQCYWGHRYSRGYF
jgi:hypothetical protein